jgi:hypothetical protein
MKRFVKNLQSVLVFIFIIVSTFSFGQSSFNEVDNDSLGISLGVFIPQGVEEIPNAAADFLRNKLQLLLQIYWSRKKYLQKKWRGSYYF